MVSATEFEQEVRVQEGVHFLFTGTPELMYKSYSASFSKRIGDEEKVSKLYNRLAKLIETTPWAVSYKDGRRINSRTVYMKTARKEPGRL